VCSIPSHDDRRLVRYGRGRGVGWGGGWAVAGELHLQYTESKVVL
jgi:hypothetical protein